MGRGENGKESGGRKCSTLILREERGAKMGQIKIGKRGFDFFS